MRRGRGRTVSRGFTFVAALLLLALVSLGLAVAGPLWSQQAQRERERELLRMGALYAQAIAAYRSASPGSDKRYPEQLEWLLLDRRFVGTVRHLRRLYPDPVNPGQPWGLVRDGAGQIVGVHSLSTEPPLAQGPLQWSGRVLGPVRRYADWQFLAVSES